MADILRPRLLKEVVGSHHGGRLRALLVRRTAVGL